VTAGNSSQMSDGAGAVLVVSEKILKQFNLKPLARFAGYAVGGVAPEIMGIGPVEAIPRVLSRPESSRTRSTGSNSTKPLPRRRWP
jgi:acetyl-CoA acyltransferase